MLPHIEKSGVRERVTLWRYQQRNVSRWNKEEDSPSVSWNWTTWKLPWLRLEEEMGGEKRWWSSKAVLGCQPARKIEGRSDCVCYLCASAVWSDGKA